MKLTLHERFALLQLLPAEGNLGTLKLVRRLREALAHLSEADKETCGWDDKSRPGHVTWQRDFERTFRLTPTATALIVHTLQKLNDTGKLYADLESVAEKFLGSPSDNCEAIATEEDVDLPESVRQRVNGELMEA